jgi:hypothetical protein
MTSRDWASFSLNIGEDTEGSRKSGPGGGTSRPNTAAPARPTCWRPAPVAVLISKKYFSATLYQHMLLIGYKI